MRRLPQEVRDAIARHGIRNGLLTSIAPTSTISLLAGNLSSGIEPIFAHEYERAVLMLDGELRHERVEDWAVRLWRETSGADAPLPPAFVDAQSLAPGDHLVMQVAA